MCDTNVFKLETLEMSVNFISIIFSKNDVVEVVKSMKGFCSTYVLRMHCMLVKIEVRT